MSVRAATMGDFSWFAQRTGYVLPSNARGVVTGPEGAPRGMVAFDTWTPNSAHAHVAIDAPGSCRTLLVEAFRYAFSAVGVLIGLIREANAKSVRLARHLGFREISRVRDGWQAGEALLVFEMRREECRWLKGGTS